jgi:hypothetical protein
MAASDKSARIYEELAEIHGRQQELRQRDVFLVLAADAALASGQRDQAERLRQRLLTLNPHHLLKPFTSLGQALQSPDIQEFVADLRRQCPPESAAQILEARRNGVPPTGLAPVVKSPEPELKVYRLQEAAEVPAVPAENHSAPTPAAPSAPPPARPRPAVPVRPRATESPYAKDLFDAVSAKRKGPKLEDSDAGAWIAMVLFILVLIGAVALAGYTLLVPFFRP